MIIIILQYVLNPLIYALNSTRKLSFSNDNNSVTFNIYDWELYIISIVEPTNEMKSLIAALREEENRIFFEMIQSIGM